MTTEIWDKFTTVHNFIWGSTDPLKKWFIDEYQNDKKFKPSELTDWNSCMQTVTVCKDLLDKMRDGGYDEYESKISNMDEGLKIELHNINGVAVYDMCVRVIKFYITITGDDTYSENWG